MGNTLGLITTNPTILIDPTSPTDLTVPFSTASFDTITPTGAIKHVDDDDNTIPDVEVGIHNITQYDDIEPPQRYLFEDKWKPTALEIKELINLKQLKKNMQGPEFVPNDTFWTYINGIVVAGIVNNLRDCSYEQKNNHVLGRYYYSVDFYNSNVDKKFETYLAEYEMIKC